MNGDLISREALLEELEVSKYVVPNSINTLLNNEIDRCILAVQYAPTVSDRYGEGYAQGYIDGSTGADWKGGAE